jgi:hypothetical protein
VRHLRSIGTTPADRWGSDCAAMVEPSWLAERLLI